MIFGDLRKSVSSKEFQISIDQREKMDIISFKYLTKLTIVANPKVTHNQLNISQLYLIKEEEALSL